LKFQVAQSDLSINRIDGQTSHQPLVLADGKEHPLNEDEAIGAEASTGIGIDDLQ
jgi:hypothetical protein